MQTALYRLIPSYYEGQKLNWEKKWETTTNKFHNIKLHIEEWGSTHNRNQQYEI